MKPSSVVTIIILMALHVLSVYSEEGSDSTGLEIDDKLIQQILDDPQLSDLLKDPEKLMDMLKEKLSATRCSDKCSIASINRHKIIKTRESQAEGAIFLSALNVNSSQACVKACCAHSSCTTAVMKQQASKVSCYLFDCGTPTRCVFSTNPAFATVELIERNSNCIDFTNLVRSDKSGTEFRSTSTEFQSTVTVSSRTTTTAASSKPDTRKDEFPSVACAADIDCMGDNNVICADNGHCACRIGYHPVGKHCRQDCNRYQFECVNVDQPVLSECIAVYDACDGVVQCSDGSDEISCPKQHGDPKSTVEPRHVNVTLKQHPNTTVQQHPTAAAFTLQSPDTDDDTANSDISKKRLEQQVATKAAVIAQCFGIMLVVILLIFAVCYFCCGSKRSRKGRLNVKVGPDYLVDGMYL